MSNYQTLAILLGLGTNGLAVARALGSKKVPLVVLEEVKNKEQPYVRTKYGEKFFLDVLVGKPLIEFFKRIEKTAIIFPTSDHQVKWLSDNRHNIPSNFILMFPESHVINLLINKDSFLNFCLQNKLPITPFITIRQDDKNALEKVGSLNFPVVVKTPGKIYKEGLKKAYIANDLYEFGHLWRKISKIFHEFLIQEYIPGGDKDVYFCLQYIDKKGRLLASFTGRKIRQWIPNCGGTASCEPVTMPKLHKMTYKIFSKAGFWGIGSIEFKRDPRSGKFYIIEPTVCRTDFQEQVAIVNGVNIPWIAYQNTIGLNVKPVIVNGGKKAWMHILNDLLAADYYRKQHQLSFWSWVYSLRNVRSFDLLSITDPGPSLVVFWQYLKKYYSFKRFPYGN